MEKGQCIRRVTQNRFAALLLILSVAGLLAGCNDLCSSNVALTSASPDSRYEATLTERNCGATTKMHFDVIVKDKKSGAEGSFDGSHVESMEWKSPTTLIMRYHNADILYYGKTRWVAPKTEQTFQDVRVVWEEAKGKASP